MILWTPLPLEQVLDDTGRAFPATEEVVVEGTRLQVEPLDGHRARVVRLLSLDPADYLDPRWQPGQVISYNVQPIPQSDEIFAPGLK